MRIEILDGNGMLLGTTNGIRDAAMADEDVAAYVKAGYAAASWREVDPANVAAEEAEKKAEQEFEGAVRRALPRVLFSLENRIRLLEAKNPVTRETFVDALRKLA